VFALFRDEKGKQFGYRSLGTSVSTHNKPKTKPLVRKNDIDSIIFQLSLRGCLNLVDNKIKHWLSVN
jgi:hypothetical protein